MFANAYNADFRSFLAIAPPLLEAHKLTVAEFFKGLHTASAPMTKTFLADNVFSVTP